MSELYLETDETSTISLKLQLEKVYEFVDTSKLVFLTYLNSEGYLKSKTVPINKRFNGVDLWLFISRDNFNTSQIQNPIISVTFVNDNTGEWITYNGKIELETQPDIIQSILKNQFQRVVYNTTNHLAHYWSTACSNMVQLTQKVVDKFSFHHPSNDQKDHPNESESESDSTPMPTQLQLLKFQSISIQTNFKEPKLIQRIYQAAKGSLIGENTRVMVIGELNSNQLDLARQIETPLIKSKL